MKKQDLGDKIISVLDEIYDPEIPVSIYELGLIYDVKVSAKNAVKVIMTLTSPSCPVAESLPEEIKLPKLKSTKVSLYQTLFWNVGKD
jgi:metal-sulfur cluster biosynthetic enzyme